jgi:ParB/RepB/Spo0J family partition protein
MATTSNSHNPSTNGNGNGNGNASNGRVELRNILLSKILVSDGFNPRGEIVEDAELEAMAQTMRDRGCLQSIRVRATGTDDYVLVSGERRYRAAALAALTEIPATVLSAGAGDEAEQLDLLCDAMIENEVRSNLDPLQRAQGYQAMVDAGLSVRGVAERLGGKTKRGSRERRIREHLAILTLSEKLRAMVAAEKIPLLAVKALAALCEIHEDLAGSAVAAVLDVGAHSEPYTWAEVVREPLAIAVDSSDSLPEGLFQYSHSYPLQTFCLSEKAMKDLAAYEKLTGREIAEVRFTSDHVEQARLLGATHDFGWGALIAGQDVGDRLAEDYIASTLKRARAEQRREREADKARQDAGGSAGTGAQPAPGGTPEGREERCQQDAKAQRQADQEQRDRAVRFNFDLGVLAIKYLPKIRVDERVLRILASVDIGGALSGIAARGARLALPGWVTQTQQRNGKTKTVYLEPHDVTRKAEEFLCGAQSAGDIAGRALTLIALASLADEDAIARSRRSFYMLSWRGPWAAQAKRDLHAIVRERIKEGQLPALDELLAERITMDEENAQLEAEIEQALARLDGVSERLDQLTDAELDQAIGDAELAWDTYSVKTHRLRADVEAERLRRTGGDTGEEHTDQPEEEQVAVAA